MRSSRFLAPTLGLALAGTGLTLAAPASAAPPSNDDLADAVALAPTQQVDLVEATLEDGEQASCADIDRSAWFELTAAEGTIYRVSTSTGAGARRPADTVLAAYTSEVAEPEIGDLTEVACNDELDGGPNGPSSTIVTVPADGTVWVQVGLFVDSTARPFTLTSEVVPPPANDDFANPETLDGPSGSVAGDSTAATTEDDEPAPAGRSTWYSWRAPASGPVAFTAIGDGGPLQDMALRVYTGTSLTTITEVASSDDVGIGQQWSRASFDAVEDTTYVIVVNGRDSPGNPAGPFTLSWGDPPQRSTTTITLAKKAKAGARPVARIAVRVGPRGDTVPGRGRVEVSVEAERGAVSSFDIVRLDAEGRADVRLPRLTLSSRSLIVRAFTAATRSVESSEDRETIRVVR